MHKTRLDLKLGRDYPALVIFYQFKGQAAEKFLLTLEEHT